MAISGYSAVKKPSPFAAIEEARFDSAKGEGKCACWPSGSGLGFYM